jgi:hypothetical protein
MLVGLGSLARSQNQPQNPKKQKFFGSFFQKRTLPGRPPGK